MAADNRLSAFYPPTAENINTFPIKSIASSSYVEVILLWEDTVIASTKNAISVQEYGYPEGKFLMAIDNYNRILTLTRGFFIYIDLYFPEKDLLCTLLKSDETRETS